MNPNKKIRDLCVVGTPAQLAMALESLRDSALRAGDWLRTNAPETDERLALHSLLGGIPPLIPLLEAGNDLQMLAFASRNIFEINLRVRYVLLSEAKVSQWLAESYTDSIQVIDSILSLANEQHAALVVLLEGEKTRLRQVAEQFGIGCSGKILSVAELAKAVERESDYKAFFKIYSKLVHPSSFLINGTAEQSYGELLRNTLLVNAQLNAHDTLKRVQNRFGIPDSAVHNAPQ